MGFIYYYVKVKENRVAITSRGSTPIWGTLEVETPRSWELTHIIGSSIGWKSILR